MMNAPSRETGTVTHGDDGGAEALQEDIHDDEHQNDRLEQRVDDFLHRGLDRQGGIQRDVVIHVGRESFLGGPEDLLDVVSGFDGVRAGREVNADGTRGRLI